MSEINNGGPAFPFEYHNQTPRYQKGFYGTGDLAPDASQQFAGMSLRDWFAGQALPSIILATSRGEHDPCAKHGCGVEKAIALDAYAMADAMLEARKEKP